MVQALTKLDERFESGIDYLTTTKRRSARASAFVSLSERILQREISEGNDCKPWGMSGYRGYRAGGVEVGERADGFICRLSSGTADENWRRVYALADNCSRIDLQVTCAVDTSPQRYIANAYKKMSRRSRESSRRAVVSILRSSDGPATVYSGKRASAIFGRIYDKGAESGHEWYKGCVRHEIELKGDAAGLVAMQLARSRTLRRDIASGVQRIFGDRGHVLMLVPMSPLEFAVPRSRPDDARRLRWLAESVKSTVEILVEHGRVSDVIRALALENALGVKSTRKIRAA